MIIKIDNRESELIRSCKYILEICPSYKNIQILVENLPVGDVILSKNNVDKIIIERKNLQDLAASIKDGRYEEQSYRLNGLPIDNHNIFYLIEGDMNKFNVFKDRMEKMTLYSAMVSLNCYKGFSVLRSLNIDESALIICNMANKINKCDTEGKVMYYPHQNSKVNEKSEHAENIDNAENANSEEDKQNNYCNVVKKVKKENITPENIGEIMLSQIPGVSSITAIAIMNRYKSISNLIAEFNENHDFLKDVSYTNAKGQIRKINKTAINNIIKYLCPKVFS